MQWKSIMQIKKTNMDTEKLKDLLTQIDCVEMNLNEAREAISRGQAQCRDLRYQVLEILNPEMSTKTL